MLFPPLPFQIKKGKWRQSPGYLMKSLRGLRFFFSITPLSFEGDGDKGGKVDNDADESY
jgi:hypothetical protein